MKVLKIGLLVATVGSFLMVAGCAKDNAQTAPAAQSQPSHVYQGKLGPTSTNNDVNK